MASASCAPDYARTLRIPFTSELSGPHLVDVPVDGLRSHWADLDLGQAAFYHGGKSPLPTSRIDRNGDGEPDAIRLPLDLDASSAWLLVVSPATPEPESALPDLPPTDAVQFDFDHARR